MEIQLKRKLSIQHQANKKDKKVRLFLSLPAEKIYL